MQCLDCTKNQEITQAVGVCTVCGAAVCDRHSVEGLVRATFVATPGDPVVSSSAGRRVFCLRCAPAPATRQL